MKKKGFKPAKIGAIFLVAVMGMAAIGAGYAHWQEILTINGVMTTDDINPIFAVPISNDDPDDPVGSQMDPDGCGVWDISTGTPVWDPNNEVGRRDKNVGNTDVYTADDDQTLNIVVNDAYPCYYSHVWYCIRNIGSCPVLVHEVLKLKKLSIQTDINDPTTHQDIDIDDVVLELYETYYVDVYLDETTWKGNVVKGPVDNPALFDFSIMLTGDDIHYKRDFQLDPWDWDNGAAGSTVDVHMQDPSSYHDQINSDVCIHFENGCIESVIYDFEFGMVWFNWPELSNTPPVANADGPYSGIPDQDIVFDGSGSYDPDGTIVSYLWDFGDSSIGSGVNPTHAYSDPGDYNVMLTVTDNDGVTDTDMTTVTVENPVVVFHDLDHEPDTWGWATAYSDPITLTVGLTEEGGSPLKDQATEPKIVYLEYSYDWINWIQIDQDALQDPSDLDDTLTFTFDTQQFENMDECSGDWPIRFRFDGDSRYDFSNQLGTLNVFREDVLFSDFDGDWQWTVNYQSSATITIHMRDNDAENLYHQQDQPKTVYLELFDGINWVLLDSDVLQDASNNDNTLDFGFTVDQLDGSYPIRFRFDGDCRYSARTQSGTLIVQDSSLRGYWKFDEASGSTAVDSSMYNNNGNILGATRTTSGKINGALSFDGTNDYVHVNFPNYNFPRFTLELWINVPSYSRNVHYISLYQNAYLVLGGGWGSNRICTWAAGLSPIEIIFSTTSLTTNAWHHIAFTYDGTYQRIYVDGTEQVKTTSSGSVIHSSGYNSGLNIGARYTSSNQFVLGTLDEVKIYSRALTGEEIQKYLMVTTYLSDNFNDNSLDTAKWTLDVTGSTNSYQETNQEAKFNIDTAGRVYLNSREIVIPSWNTITIEGKWKYVKTGTRTAEMNFYFFDWSDNTKFVGMAYDNWNTRLRCHYAGSTYQYISRSSPSSYATFRFVITKTAVSYYENNVLIMSRPSTILATQTHFKLRIGGWDASSISGQDVFFDDIRITAT